MNRSKLKLSSNIQLIYFILGIIIINSLNLHAIDYVNAQILGNMTSKCSGQKCTTIVCIDGGPCETIKSNSNNFTELQDFLENKTQVTLIPRQIV